MEKEIWKDIEGYEGIFQVSNLGRIRSLDRYVNTCHGAKRIQKGRILKPTKCKNGYYEAQINHKGKRKIFLLHRLVGKYFLENPDNLPEINHKDEDVSNNCVENLEWCTSKYNANYGTRNIRMMEGRNFKPVIQLSKNGEFIKKWDKMSDACKETGADCSSLIRVCKGKQKTCVGYIWKYLE